MTTRDDTFKRKRGDYSAGELALGCRQFFFFRWADFLAFGFQILCSSGVDWHKSLQRTLITFDSQNHHAEPADVDIRRDRCDPQEECIVSLAGAFLSSKRLILQQIQGLPCRYLWADAPLRTVDFVNVVRWFPQLWSANARCFVSHDSRLLSSL